ncbi:MAG: type II toxin-antitoxin system Phd/YefM family antitoxin [Gammaproteobacteria bacterium]|nr:type II toxin-antitoxin system Phd/YefM family antitoxin [Gammaproteobacteria bacterium]
MTNQTNEDIMKEIGISELKAKCIDQIKTVQRTGEPLLVTLRKRPVAVISPYTGETPHKRKLGALRGQITIHGDIVSTDFVDEWEFEQ